MRIIRSTRAMALSHVATPATPRDSSVPNIRTGNPVPIANTAGNATPPVDLRAIGIKAPKRVGVPVDHHYVVTFPLEQTSHGRSHTTAAQNDYSPSQMMKTLTFWIMWAIYFIGAGTGLMVIGSVAGLAKKSMGEAAFVAVAIMAIGNAGGRIVAGIVSDKVGRNVTLAGILIFQAVLMLAAIPTVNSQETSALMIVLLATFIGFNYGANLSLFPSFAKDRWGLKSFGINYGFLFTAWGIGGFVMSRMSQMLMATTDALFTPKQVPAVKTKYRAMETPIPAPGSIPILERLAENEPRSMRGQPPIVSSSSLR